jgi:hypothetical protein
MSAACSANSPSEKTDATSATAKSVMAQVIKMAQTIISFSLFDLGIALEKE